MVSKLLKNLFSTIIIIILSPLIVIAGICSLFLIPKIIKEYKSSRYYKDFRLPFKIKRLNSPEYRFYNALKSRRLSVNYVMQKSNGFEYFILDNTIYIFPDFEYIDYDNEKSEWKAEYKRNKSVSFEQSYQNLISKFESNAPKLPVKLLVERSMFHLLDLTDVELPNCVFLTWNYETSFENEDSPLKLIVPQSTKDLYEMMIATPDLCGSFELVNKNNNNAIHWNLYEDIQIELCLDYGECYFGVNKKGVENFKSNITHWHPDIYDIYTDICRIGKCGNVLVIKAFSNGADVLYMGDEENCPYLPTQKFYYLKAEKYIQNQD